jgi:hypothetical protein
LLSKSRCGEHDQKPVREVHEEIIS